MCVLSASNMKGLKGEASRSQDHLRSDRHVSSTPFAALHTASFTMPFCNAIAASSSSIDIEAPDIGGCEAQLPHSQQSEERIRRVRAVIVPT